MKREAKRILIIITGVITYCIVDYIFEYDLKFVCGAWTGMALKSLS